MANVRLPGGGGGNRTGGGPDLGKLLGGIGLGASLLMGGGNRSSRSAGGSTGGGSVGGGGGGGYARPTQGTDWTKSIIGAANAVNPFIQRSLDALAKANERPGVQSLEEILASLGMGGGGGGGGGFGAAAAFDAAPLLAARDSALADIKGAYAAGDRGFVDSEKRYKAISDEEKAALLAAQAEAAKTSGASYSSAQADRDASRKALGIEDAAAVVNDALSSGKAGAASNIARSGQAAQTRATEHRANNLTFNEDLRNITSAEGRNSLAKLQVLYASRIAEGQQQAQSAAVKAMQQAQRGAASSSSANLRTAQAIQKDQQRMYDSMYNGADNASMMRQLSKQYPKAKLSELVSLAKLLGGK